MSHTGSWEGPFDTKGSAGDLFGVHAALMYSRRTRKAKVLLFSGKAGEGYPLESVLWDPETNEFTSQTWSSYIRLILGFIPIAIKDDLFCCHHCFLDDGRLLVMGGTHKGEEGSNVTNIFDPEGETWKKVGDMTFHRWYPTAVMLPNGKVLVFSGNAHHEWWVIRHIVKEIEEFDPTPSRESWTTLPESAEKKLQIYPGLHLVPAGNHAGKIFYSGTRWVRDRDHHDKWAAPDTAVFDPSTNTWLEVSEHVHKNRSEGTSVLLPPAQQARVLVIGGGHNAHDAEPDTAEIINLRDRTPTWELTPKMTSKRTNVNAVILPDQTVFVCGGQQKWKKKHHGGDPDPVLECTIYDPEDPADPWKVAASMAAPRQYHSVALLLPDGRVLAAGGITFSDDGDEVDQKNMEIYSPPYMFAAARPEITQAPDDIGYKLEFGISISTPGGSNIDKVVLIRPSAVTHHTNTEQRLVTLEFEYFRSSISARPFGSTIAEHLLVTGPSNTNLAPPGYYMLFIVDGDRTPSIARFVRLGTGIIRPPQGPVA